MSEADPIYVRLQRDVMDLLKQGNYKPGSKIPSERELSSKFGASRMTTRKAIDKLVDKGALERRGTSGTFLPEKLLKRSIESNIPHGFSAMAEERGRNSGSKLLYFEVQSADELSAGHLQIEIGEPILVMQRLRTIEDVPVCIEITKFPEMLVPGLTAADVLDSKSLRDLIEERYGYRFVRGPSSISISWLSKQEAKILKLPDSSPVLDYSLTTLMKDGQPFEFLRSINHPNYVSFHIPTQFIDANQDYADGAIYGLVD